MAGGADIRGFTPPPRVTYAARKDASGEIVDVGIVTVSPTVHYETANTSTQAQVGVGPGANAAQIDRMQAAQPGAVTYNQTGGEAVRPLEGPGSDGKLNQAEQRLEDAGSALIEYVGRNKALAGMSDDELAKAIQNAGKVNARTDGQVTYFSQEGSGTIGRAISRSGKGYGLFDSDRIKDGQGNPILLKASDGTPLRIDDFKILGQALAAPGGLDLAKALAIRARRNDSSALSDAYDTAVDAKAAEIEEALGENAFRIMDSSGAWQNENVFKEQIWMLKHWMPKNLRKNAKTYNKSPTHSLNDSDFVRYIYTKTTSGCDNLVSNLLALENVDIYASMPPSLYALLVPRIILYVEEHDPNVKNGKVKIRELRFDEYLAEKDLMDLIQGKKAKLPGVGIVSISLEDKASNAAELRRNYTLKLQIRSNSIQDFSSKDKSGRATFHDLWYNVSQTKRTAGSGGTPGELDGPNNIVRVELGWQTPTIEAIQMAYGRGCTPGQAKRIRTALEKNNMTYRLYLVKYNLIFNQDGSVQYDGEYQAAYPSEIFSGDAFPLADGGKFKVRDPDDPTKVKEVPLAKLNDIFRKSEERQKELRKKQAKANEQMMKFLKRDPEKKKSGTQRKEEEIKSLDSKIKNIQRRNERLKRRVRSQRFRGVANQLINKEYVFVTRVTYNSEKESLEELNMLVGDTGAADKGVTAGNVNSAQNDARKALRTAGSENLGDRRLNLISLQQAVAINKEGGHMIPWVRFGSIVESFVDIIAKYSDKKETKNPYGNNFQIQLGPAYIRYAKDQVYVCNVGELPITMNRFTQFMQAVYSSMPWDGSPFPFSQLFQMMCSFLLGEPLNSYDFLVESDEDAPGAQDRNKMQARHVAKIKTFSADYNFMSKYKKGELIRLSGEHRQTAGNLLSSKDKNSFGAYSNSIRNLKNKKKVMDIYFVYIQQYCPAFLSGKVAENNKFGIFHFFIGSDTGILKTLDFQEDNIPGRQEAVLLGQSSASDRQIFKFDANLKLMGNSLFSNGDLIYIDPAFAGRGNTSMLNNGLGGYYYVTKVNHVIARTGFETELLAKWNSFATGVKDTTNFNYYCAEGTWDDEIKGKVKVKGEDRDTTGNVKEWDKVKKKSKKKAEFAKRDAQAKSIQKARFAENATAEQKEVLNNQSESAEAKRKAAATAAAINAAKRTAMRRTDGEVTISNDGTGWAEMPNHFHPAFDSSYNGPSSWELTRDMFKVKWF